MIDETPPVLSAPKLIDLALIEIQAGLVSALDWLDYAFGKSFPFQETIDGKTSISPTVYAGKKEYLKMWPDDKLGNFSWFDIKDGETMEGHSQNNIRLVAEFGLVVWFDYQSIFPTTWETRSIENVKELVLNAFLGCVKKQSQVKVESFAERDSSIYTGYTYSDIQKHYLKRPYGAFRINGEIKYNQKQLCSNAVIAEGMGAMMVQ